MWCVNLLALCPSVAVSALVMTSSSLVSPWELIHRLFLLLLWVEVTRVSGKRGGFIDCAASCHKRFFFFSSSLDRRHWSLQDHLQIPPPQPAMCFKGISNGPQMQNGCSLFKKTPVKTTKSSPCKESWDVIHQQKPFLDPVWLTRWNHAAPSVTSESRIRS